jgi:hypothetical protein
MPGGCKRRDMKLFLAAVLMCAACSQYGCASRADRAGPPVIDFQEMTVAGIRPGDRDEAVVEAIGRPYEIIYGRADSPKEIWSYYDLGMKVVVGKQSRGVEEVVVFFNRTRAYRPFRGKIAQGFPLDVRLVDAKPHLGGYREVDTSYRGYKEFLVYSDDVETAKVLEEIVSLQKADGATMTVHFDYHKWLARVVLASADVPVETGAPAGEVAGEETQAEEAAVPAETPDPGP